MPLPHLACRHWELLGSHLYSPEEGRYKLEKYRKLDAFAIADPQLSVGKASIKAKGFYDDHADNRSEFITTRLEDILILCQLRIIQDMAMSEIRNVNSLFRPIRPFFNPGHFRHEAAGAIAARRIQAVDYRGRIVLARINGIVSQDTPNG
ncbi:hypothetical protein F4825DRAFT_449429 [Nemania diffusa]|nr:hypothetical protein F4825DRAFT_449429 [Nemania diffusa]